MDDNRLLTDDDLAAIAARAEAATPGPWEPFYNDDKTIERSIFIGFGVSGPPEAYKEPFAMRADAEFIAAARADIPALLAHADALAADNARLREALLNIQRIAWQLEHDGPRYYERKQSPYGEYLKCMYCGEISADAGEFRHTEKCPVRRLYEMKDARALLDGEGGA